MGEFIIKLPDVGEGVAEAELVEWLVEEGKNVREDEVLASVMTDKATVEIPSPVEGKVIWLGAKIGEIVPVGSPIIRLEIDGEGNVAPGANADKAAAREAEPEKQTEDLAQKPNGAGGQAKPSSHAPAKMSVKSATPARASASSGPPRAEGESPMAAPAIRKRALDAGIDLRRVRGTGPAGRIMHDDLDAYFETGAGIGGGKARVADNSVKEIKIVGMRRKIAEKMSIAKSRIPHITYVEEIDVTTVEGLRSKLNAAKRDDQSKLTLLPFLMQAMVKAIAEQPQLNSRFDDEAGIVHQYGGMHMGVAAQTENGLVVPVIRHVESLSLRDCASELARLSEAARTGSATREELSGSTITITSLGAMGGVVTTPVINHPEVAIIGVNKMRTLPQWDGTQFIPRKMMNLSSSFDHRIIDGWDAAVFIQRIKTLLENPAMIFIED